MLPFTVPYMVMLPYMAVIGSVVSAYELAILILPLTLPKSYNAVVPEVRLLVTDIPISTDEISLTLIAVPYPA